MNIFKRIEIWVLLAVVVIGLAFVFFSRRHGDDQPTAAAPESVSATEEAPLKIHRCVLERDYSNARLDIELRVRNSSAEKLVLQSPKTKLLADKGREIPSFFLPFDQQPEVAANSTQDVQLRYWLDAADLQGTLKLEVAGKTVEVKSAKPFDLNSLKNPGKKIFNAGEW